MTDKRIKENCPFCNEAAEKIQINSKGRFYNKLTCTNCGVNFSGAYSKQDLIDRWNRRWR